MMPAAACGLVRLNPPEPEPEPEPGAACDSSFALKCLYANQIGDAELYKRRHRGLFLYDYSINKWMKYTGNFFEPDRIEESTADVQNVCKEYELVLKQMSFRANSARARGEQDKKAEQHEKAIRARITALQARARINDVLALARTGADGLSTGGDLWDKNPLLLACPNGVLDLETGQFRQGRPDDMILTHTETIWKGADEPCPTWERFLLEIMDNAFAMVDFLHRGLGYCLSGLSIERLLLIFYGQDGQNGKGTLLETLYRVMGGFAGEIPAETLLVSSRDTSGAVARPDLMQLRGKRLVWCSETGKQRALDAATMKWLSGGDTVVCRPLYGQLTSFEQTAKIVLLTNHKPRVDGNDPAIWHRLLLVPFVLSFVENPKLSHERKRDKHLMEKLLKESSGILAWLYRGFRKWREQGINPPAAVLAATESYRAENNSIVQFLSDACLIMPGVRVKPADLFEAYQKFCTDAGLEQDNGQSFYNEMKKRFECERTHGGRWYIGISLKADYGA